MIEAYYPTKKALKASIGQALYYGETSVFGPEYTDNGTFNVVGPCARQKRVWYAIVTMHNGKIEKVK